MATLTIGISGIQAAQQANEKMIATLKPGGGFSKAIWRITISLHRYAIGITHVQTGALRASHRMRMSGDLTSEIYIDKSSTNPRSKSKPYIYGMYEEERGGAHAFYGRTVNEAAPSIVAREAKGIF